MYDSVSKRSLAKDGSGRLSVQAISIMYEDAKSVSDLDDYFLNGQRPEYEYGDDVDLTMWDKVLGRRFVKRIDRFTRMSLYCADSCLTNNNLKFEWDDSNNTDIGISVGNNYGGWSYVIDQMRGLYEDSMYAINPYVATAWFPAAAQGEISIRHNIRGHSKTFSCDRLSSGVAIEYACDLINNGTVRYCLTGGAEAPTSELIRRHLSRRSETSVAFNAKEAACLLFLSQEEGPDPICYISTSVRRATLESSLSECLEQYGKSVDYCMLPATNIEYSAGMRDQLGSELRNLVDHCNGAHVGVPARVFGYTGGASFSFQVATAVWMFKKSRLPDARLEEYADEAISSGLKVGVTGEDIDLESILVIEKDRSGQYQCMILERA